nr:sterile alpha motif domain-containing protein 9-like [Lytechinus pictus]
MLLQLHQMEAMMRHKTSQEKDTLTQERDATTTHGSKVGESANKTGIASLVDTQQILIGPEKVQDGTGHLQFTPEENSEESMPKARDDGVITRIPAEGSTGATGEDENEQSKGICVEKEESAGEHPTKRKLECKQNQGVQLTETMTSVGQETSQCLPLSKEEESAEEAKLRFLLTGDENGSLDSSFHPILVLNKPMLGGSKISDLESLQENLDFLSVVNWNAVFDCNSKSFVNGICSMVKNKREIKLLLPKIFHSETSTEEMEFNDVPSWIFANGRDDLEDLQNPSLECDWNEKYGADVDRAVDFFATTAIPKERAVIVFLILSHDNIQIMSDIFKKFQSSLQGSGTFTFIAENRELYDSWADEVKKWLPRDQLDKRSFICKDWKRINDYIKKQYGQVAIVPSELPFSTGKSCILPDKIRSKWLNIEVLPRNECENTAMNESSPGFQKFVSDQELAFYQGNEVSWWNFHLSEDSTRKGGYNQVLRREASKSLNKVVKEKLKPSNPSDGSNSVVTITIFHEPGSGASTTSKQVLWDFHRKLRCITVKRVILATVEEILEVRKFGYGSKDEIPPVLVLLDDMDDAEVMDLIAQLETATNDYGCLSCIILHCKRTSDPELVALNDGVNSVVLRHKLNKCEHSWFEEKFKSYEDEYSQSPEKLIGFMVMKEECNPDYITRIVSNILCEVTGYESMLLKYIAVLNRFIEDFGMPVSCCDEFMGTSKKRPSSRGRSKMEYVPWENLLSKALCLLLIQTKVYTRNGPTKAIKLVNHILATEVVSQLLEESGQTIGNIFRELMNESRILDSRAYTSKYMIYKIRELLVRRKEGDMFSPFVEHLLTEDKKMAFSILQEASEKFKNGHIAQQLARLYKSENNLVEAQRYAEMAVKCQNRPFFWDTRGRIVLAEMKKLKKNTEPLHDTDKIRNLLSLLDDGMNFFRTCQDLQNLEPSLGSNYAAYSGELKVIFTFLHIMEQRIAPFCRSNGMQKMKDFFLTDEDISGLGKLWNDRRQHLIAVQKRTEVTLDHVGDLLTYSRGITRTKQDSQDEVKMRNDEFVRFCEDYLRFYTVDKEQHPPRSVQGNPDSMSSWRRAQVKAMKADSFHAIFKLAQNGKMEYLKKVQEILLAIKSKNAFDLKILVCISFALSSLGEDIDYDTVIRQVEKLNEVSNSLYGAFFTMMLAWPRGKLPAGYRSVKLSTEKAVVQLRGKWNDLQRNDPQKRGIQYAYDRSLPRHQTIVRKPLTHFLLTNREGLQAFVHVNMFHASQSTLEGEKHRFWMRKEVTDRLIRLEGTILDRERLVFRTPAKEQIYIKLSSRWQNQPSNERVTFYLGFNFAGPVAYDVSDSERDRNPIPVQVKDYRETFPGYLVGQLSQLQKKESDLVYKLEEIEYMSKKRRNRQQLTPEDKELMQTKPKLEEELARIRSQIQKEVDNNDDDDEQFFLVGRRRGRQRLTGAVSK